MIFERRCDRSVHAPTLGACKWRLHSICNLVRILLSLSVTDLEIVTDKPISDGADCKVIWRDTRQNNAETMCMTRLLSPGVILLGCASLAALAACAEAPSLPQGAAAYQLIHPASDSAWSSDYHIGRLDVLKVTVLYEPDLSTEAHVDANGDVSLPLIGVIRAVDKTPAELSVEISSRFGAQYLRNPHVTVAVETSASQKVTIEGDVNMPGVYDINGKASLLEALARAQSPNRVANLRTIAVFRVIDGRRVGAVFDVTRIRAGLDPDPLILGGDIVVVGFSYAKGFYRDVVQAAPVVGAFHGW
jgi:polysaccharide export outer membrane protein